MFAWLCHTDTSTANYVYEYCTTTIHYNEIDFTNSLLIVTVPFAVEEGLNAAAQIGDDTLLRKAGHKPHPSMYTHGSSEQRQKWFTEGLRNGKVENCNTFREARVNLN